MKQIKENVIRLKRLPSSLFSAPFNFILELYKNEDKEDTLGFITRTNNQASRVSEILTNMGVDHYCSTPKEGSIVVKNSIINLLDSLFHPNNKEKLLKGVASPFSGVPLRAIFELYIEKTTDDKYYQVSFDDLRNNVEFKPFVKLVNKMQNVPPEDVYNNLKTLFTKIILPNSVAFGEEGFIAAKKIYAAALSFFENLDLYNPLDFLQFLKLTDVSEQKNYEKKKITVTTAHKAKGLSFDIVVYLPSSTQSRYSQLELIVSSALNVLYPLYNEEEISEESIRIDYVAFTRAVKRLYLALPDDERFDRKKYLLNGYIQKGSFSENATTTNPMEDELFHTHSTLFSNLIQYLNGDITETDLLNKLKKQPSKNWLKSLIISRLKSRLEKVSFSSLKSPVRLLLNSILSIPSQSSYALSLGQRIHTFYEELFSKNTQPQTEEEHLFYRNREELIRQLKTLDPKIKQKDAELSINLKREQVEEFFGPLPQWIKFFKGQIDAVFEGEYIWLVDYKTSRSEDDKTYFQQLALYRYLYSKYTNTPLDRIKIAIFYVYLRRSINDSNGNPIIEVKLGIPSIYSSKRGRKTEEDYLNEFKDRLYEIIEYVKDPDIFIEDLEEDLLAIERAPHTECYNGDIVRRVIEEYKRLS